MYQLLLLEKVFKWPKMAKNEKKFSFLKILGQVAPKSDFSETTHGLPGPYYIRISGPFSWYSKLDSFFQLARCDSSIGCWDTKTSLVTGLGDLQVKFDYVD